MSDKCWWSTPSTRSIPPCRSLGCTGPIPDPWGWCLQPAVIWTSCYFWSQPFEPHNKAHFTSTLKKNSPSHIPLVLLQVDNGRPCQVLYGSQWHSLFSPVHGSSHFNEDDDQAGQAWFAPGNSTPAANHLQKRTTHSHASSPLQKADT